MADPRQPVLTPFRPRVLKRSSVAAVVLACFVLVSASALAISRRFYPDDPIARDPAPMPVGDLRTDAHTEASDLLHATLHAKNDVEKRTPALDINTIDEIPDGPWFTNRHYTHPLSNAELVLGPGGNQPPATDRQWTIYEANEGASPIFRIEDSGGRRYALRFDPKDYIELTTGADVVGSRLFHALGYNVPDNYAVRFPRNQLRAAPNVRFLRDGQRVVLRESDVDHLLDLTPRYHDGTYRALASRLIDGKLLGPFEYSGTRADDPNDTVPHERRRIIRALYVFNAWLDHVDTRSLGTLDTIQNIEGVRAVRHYLIDFGSSLGSGDLRPKESWEGHTYAVDLSWGLRELLTLGAYSPKWERAKPAVVSAAGQYESDTFDPTRWKPAYPNPAFDARTPADCFWAAKQVQAFTDDQIRVIVDSGRYSDTKTVETIVHALIVRRDRLAAFFFSQTVPLDRFEVKAGMLVFHDLGGSGHYTVAWSRYDNDTDLKSTLDAPKSFTVPPHSGYLAADISDGIHQVTAYLHDNHVVGLTR